MQTKKLLGGQELICMNVDKVYDWILNEATFTLQGPDTAISFTGTLPADLSGAITTCEVTPDPTTPFIVVSRESRVFIIDGEEVTLQLVTLQKNFNVTVTVTVGGAVFTSTTALPYSRFEQIVLCAPEGTDIDLITVDLSCFVVSTGTLTPDQTAGTILFSDLVFSVISCQSIQSTYPVTVEFLAEFCQPRDILPTTCPAPTRPLQCPTVFPNLPIPPTV